jgi:hypothetical protein
VNNQPGTENLKFLIEVPIQNTDSHITCKIENSSSWQPESYTVYTCEFTVLFTFKDDFFGAEIPSENFLELYKKDLETQMFVVDSNSFNSHSIMLERFTNNCPNCNLVADPGLIYRFCSDLKCTAEITNSTRMIDTSLYFFITYEGHEYNYQRTITHVEFY